MLQDPGKKQLSDINPGQTYLLVLEIIPERYRAAVVHSMGIDTGGNHSWEILLLHGHWYW